MMKKNKSLFITLVVIFVVIVSVILYFVFRGNNALTISERKWIDNNINTVQNINIANDLEVFSKEGSGIFYDFLLDFSENYNIKINHVTHDYKNNPSSFSFTIKEKPHDKDLIFYKDHFVIISANNAIIRSYNDLVDKSVGVLTEYGNILTKYLNVDRITIKQYDEIEELFNSSFEHDYLIVPRILYLDTVFQNNFNIIYNLGEINYYYVLSNSGDTLFNIMKKYYYSKWQKNFDEVFKKNLFSSFKNNLNISDVEVESLKGGTFKYGALDNAPYQTFKNNKLFGINAQLFEDFSGFIDTEIDYVYYKKNIDFKKAINTNKITIYFDDYNYQNSFIKTASGFNIGYVILLQKSNFDYIDSPVYLEDKTVFIKKDSRLFDFFNKKYNVNIKTYDNEKELRKISKKAEIIIIERKSFENYKTNILRNYDNRYFAYLDYNLGFKVSTNSTIYKLLDKYISFIDLDEYSHMGLLNYTKTLKTTSLYNALAKYISFIFLIVVVIFVYTLKKHKKIRIAKKIRKEEKLKFVDQLTSLKNRNYLSENIESWNNNTIYPQAIVAVDLNDIKEINDQEGHEEGDKQIAAFANVLIKRQLDNSEIMRTDGNEFVIYLVGYNNLKIANYIRKLSKDLKHLPYDFGAKFGYSMILDDLKTVEDALNEALIDMREKENKKDES